MPKTKTNNIMENEQSELRIEKMIKTAIEKFEKPFHVTPLRIQLVFRLQEEKVLYILYVDKQPKNTVTLKQLIGWNLYNGKVDKMIGELLRRTAITNNIDKDDIRIMAEYGEEVKLKMMNKTEEVRELTPEELLN